MQWSDEPVSKFGLVHLKYANIMNLVVWQVWHAQRSFLAPEFVASAMKRALLPSFGRNLAFLFGQLQEFNAVFFALGEADVKKRSTDGLTCCVAAGAQATGTCQAFTQWQQLAARTQS